MTEVSRAVPPPWPGRSAAWRAVVVLMLAYTVGYVDRSIMSILVEPIQADLHINDTQIGLLHGFAFVIFYVTLGVPIGVLADRGGRKWLVVGSIALWSLMTAAGGLTRTFGQLFLARIGVGVGEAGLSPASYSLISDYFPPERRAAALGVYAIGMYLGSGLAILAGGFVLALVGARPYVDVPLLGRIRAWHLVFVAVGLPGLAMALLAMTIREPARRVEAALATTGPPGENWRATLAQVRRHPVAYGLTTLGFAFLGVPFNVAVLWARPYLSRHFGLDPTHGAYLVGWTMLVFAPAGIVMGSVLADRLQGAGRQDAALRVGLVSALAVIPPILALPVAPTLIGAAASLAVLLFFAAFAYGAAPASLQLITPNRMRATLSAVYLLAVNLVGLACGPVITGMLTDFVFHDPLAVGWSAAIVGSVSAAVAAAAFWNARPAYNRAVFAQTKPPFIPQPP